jgi:hypothetical protein
MKVESKAHFDVCAAVHGEAGEVQWLAAAPESRRRRRGI